MNVSDHTALKKFCLLYIIITIMIIIIIIIKTLFNVGSTNIQYG